MANSKIKKAISHSISKAFKDKLYNLLEKLFEGVKEKTPVITGYTKKGWYVEIDGSKYFDMPDKETVLNARLIKIRNARAWIDEVNDRHGMIQLTAFEISVLLNLK